MKVQTIAVCLASALSTLAAGCTTNIRDDDKARPLLTEADKAQSIAAARQVVPPFIRLRESGEAQATMVSQVRAVEPIALGTVLELAAPGFSVVAMDANVNLLTPVTVSAENVRLASLLDTLGMQTGYGIKAKGRSIEVSNFVSREYSLSFLASRSQASASVSGATAGNSSGASGSSGGGVGGSGGAAGGAGAGSGGGGTRQLGITIENDVDEWGAAIEQISTLIGVDEGAQDIPTVDSTGAQAAGFPGRAPSQARVAHNRSMGLVWVYGPQRQMAAVDSYIEALQKFGRKQVRLDVRAIEVSFNDSKAIGINWSTAINTIFDDALGAAGVTLGADYTVEGAAGSGAFVLDTSIAAADDRIDAMMDFLSTYGTVELRNEPQITVSNGRTAYIGSGEEFGYIASVEQTVSNGTVVATPQISRILVGVELAITPRIDENNRITLQVVPVISTFRSFDTFTLGESSFSQPRIVLNQLATEVTTSSGQPIHLGGLITSRLSEVVRGLPVERGSVLEKILSPLFSGESNALERRELMLVVTPFLVSA